MFHNIDDMTIFDSVRRQFGARASPLLASAADGIGTPSIGWHGVRLQSKFRVVASSWRQEFVARGDEDRERTKLAGRWQQYSQTANLPRAATLGAASNPNSKNTLAAFGGTEGQYHGR